MPKVRVPIQLGGSPILKRRAIRVRSFTGPRAAQLEQVLLKLSIALVESNGVGIAANQVGELLRVCIVVGPDAHPLILINPEVTWQSAEITYGNELCLSLPGVECHQVPRARGIIVRYQTVHGRRKTVKAVDFFARVIQHEIDHLDGILMTDRVPATQVTRVGASLP